MLFSPTLGVIRMAKREFSDETIVVAAESVAAAEVEGESILLDVNIGQYYGLNEVGARIMEIVQQPTPVSTIREVMSKEYEIDQDRLEHDLASFLEQMIEHQLIRIVEQASS